jgi:L-rhamnose mutarotase
MQRMGLCLKLKPGAVDEYKRLHRDVWPAVLARIAACHIKDYTIFLREPENILFATWEYHGTDYAADMAAMAADPATQEWWKLNMPLQTPFETAAPGEWWCVMEPVFHVD